MFIKGSEGIYDFIMTSVESNSGGIILFMDMVVLEKHLYESPYLREFDRKVKLY